MMKLLRLKTSFSKGRDGESAAIDFLKKNGWKVVAKNYKTSVGEIDIIAIKEELLVSFEVKYRADKDTLFYSINKTQQKRIIDAFNLFLKQNKKYYNKSLRIDAILLDGNKNIHHIENAWGEE